MSQPSPTAVAAMAGILGSAWAAGGIASISLLTIPALLTADLPAQTIATQWQIIYNAGKALMPSIAFLSLLSFTYAAYTDPANRMEYVISGVLTIAIAPFTLGVMAGTNGKLARVADGKGLVTKKWDGENEDVLVLLRRWSGLNMGRSLFPLVGAGVGLWALAGW